MRTEEDIREDILYSDWWIQAFVNCRDYLFLKPLQLEKRRRLFNELLQLQFKDFDEIN